MNREYRSTSRRIFFRAFLSETIGTVEEMRGIPQCPLADIPTISDDILREVIPLPVGQGNYCLKEDVLLRTDRRIGSDSVVRRFHEIESRILLLFDGQRTIGGVAREMAYHYLLDPEEAFQLVKSLFCEMAGFRVFIPCSPPNRDRASNSSLSV
jgi:hypothetical protein